jgi:glutamate/tyrosine decarboxylase-like PLP-dependent enzyme
LVKELASLLAGVDKSDSIAFDPHKWLSVPMGCGMYLSRHRGSLRKTFDVEDAFYMPRSSHNGTTTEPFRQSLQWSRRFMGLKLFMTLATHGEGGYQEVLRHQIAMGDYLRRELRNSNWRLKNSTPLPVVCFSDEAATQVCPELILRQVIATKKAFLTTTKLGPVRESVLRAGIPSYLTRKNHVDELVALLNEARKEIRSLTSSSQS